MNKVYNKCYEYPKDAVYCGRGSVFGNPFSHKTGTKASYRVKTREESIDRYNRYFLNSPKLIIEAKTQLKGKNLLCFCKPHACHADILLLVANEQFDIDDEIRMALYDCGYYTRYARDIKKIIYNELQIYIFLESCQLVINRTTLFE